MSIFLVPNHIRLIAAEHRLRLHASLDRAQDILDLYVTPLLIDERILWVQVTEFDPSEPSDHLFEAAIFEGDHVNRERLGLNPLPRNG